MTIYDGKLREESKIVNLLKPYSMNNKTSTRNAENQVPSKVMGEPCRHNLLCSCRRSVSEIIDDVKNKIEECIKQYMSLEETVTYLQNNHRIEGQLTKLIWERLQRENPEFFKDYNLKSEIGRQIKMFNDLLGKQVSLMLQHGEFDISNAPAAFMNFLREDPEGIRLPEKLAHIPSKKSEVSPSSLALPDTNGPTVNQLQIPPDDQQNPHPYQWSIPCSNLGAPPVVQGATNIALNEMQIPNGQQNQHPQNQWSTANDLTYNYDGAHPIPPADDSSPAFSTVAPATTAQWPPSNDIGAPTVAQSPPALFDMSTFEDGDYTEYNGPNFQLMDPLLAELITQSEYPQQSFSLEELPTLPYGVKNNMLQSGGNNYGLQCGGSNNMLQYGGSNNTLQYGRSNNELQYGGSNNVLQGVIPQHNHQLHQEKGEPLYQVHESKASNNPNSGESTLTVAQDQRDIQRKHEGRGLLKRRAI